VAEDDGLAMAVVGGVALYYAGLLFLSLVSVLLPLAGGRPKLLRDWQSREKPREDR